MKDPAVLFYTSDFLSGTMTMTNEEVGMYIRLLCLQHQKGKLTEKDMLSICRTYVQDVYSKFTKIDDFYINKRMQDETEKRSKYTESRRNNAKKKKAYAKHMGNENENVIINESINTDIIQVGVLNKTQYILIVPKTIGNKYRINGEEGLKEFFDQHGSILSRPEYSKKFIMERTGKIYSDFMHIWNDFNQFVNNQFKR